jgi:hypothetical protein
MSDTLEEIIGKRKDGIIIVQINENFLIAYDIKTKWLQLIHRTDISKTSNPVI